MAKLKKNRKTEGKEVIVEVKAGAGVEAEVGVEVGVEAEIAEAEAEAEAEEVGVEVVVQDLGAVDLVRGHIPAQDQGPDQGHDQDHDHDLGIEVDRILVIHPVQNIQGQRVHKVFHLHQRFQDCLNCQILFPVLI